MKSIVILLLLVASAIAEPRPPSGLPIYEAKVVEILDGDTVRLDIQLGFGVEMSRVSIRMIGVFAPEKNEPGGPEATAKLKELLPLGDTVILRCVYTVTGKEQMSFTRYVARIWHGDKDVCEEMTKYLADCAKNGHYPANRANP